MAVTRSRMLRAGMVLLALSAAAVCDTFTFDTDPLAGTIARSVPERLLIGGEQFIPFDPTKDVFAFGPVIFGGDNQIDFALGTVDRIPSTDVNVAVLRNLDDDNNPLTPFGAFQAADLLAGRITEHGSGVFIFFDQALDLPELIYSDDLASNQADLRVLPRLLNFGQLGSDPLSTFSTANFAIADSTSAVPEPSSLAMLGGAIALAALAAVRRHFSI